MEKSAPDRDAFLSGLARARQADAGALTHALFGVRTLGLFGSLPRSGLSSYLSGLLIGTEMQDATAWSGADAVIAVGSPKLLDNYRIAAEVFGLAFEAHDNAALLPPALFMIARDAGLVT